MASEAFHRKRVGTSISAPDLNGRVDPNRSVWLAADVSTFAKLPWLPDHGRFLCDLEATDAGCQICPRSALRRVLERIDERGLHRLQAAVECEFVLEDAARPANVGSHYCNAAALNANIQVVSAIVSAIEQQGLGVSHYHAEAGETQFEVGLSPMNPMKMADAVVIVRETISNVAQGFGLAANLSPYVESTGVANGLHVHWSFDDCPEKSGDPNCPDIEAFADGLLHHLPALLAITAPARISHERLKRSKWAGARASVEYEMRGSALRIPTSVTGIPSGRIEFRALDNLANPHLAFAAMILAGSIIGATGAKRSTTLPSTVTEAVSCLRADKDLSEGLGDYLIHVFSELQLSAEARAPSLDGERI
ncbi:MAG: hypothetical protein ACT4N8_03900 [Sphingosinicella sp.]